MERYFIIKDKELIDLYKKFKTMSEKIKLAFCEFREKHDIETKSYYQSATSLHIIATEKDMQKFSSQIKKNTDGLFKKNSNLAKEWISLCKEKEIETPYKPTWEMSRLMKHRAHTPSITRSV